MANWFGTDRQNETSILAFKILVIYVLSLVAGFWLKQLSPIPLYLDPSIGVATALALIFHIRTLGVVFLGGGIFLVLFGPYEDKIYPWSFLFFILIHYVVVLSLKKVWTINLHFSGFRSLRPLIGVAVIVGLLKGFMGRIAFFPLETIEEWLVNCFAVSFSAVAGVLIFAPLTFLFIGPLEYWRPRARVLLLSSGIFVSIFLVISAYTRNHSEEVARYDLDLRAKQNMENLTNTILLANSSLELIEAFGHTYRVWTYADFKRVASKTIQLSPLIRAITWVPQLAPENVSVFKQRMATELARPFDVFEKGLSGKSRALTLRKNYYPVSFIYPMELNEKAVGFDLGSEPLRAKAIQRAIEKGEPASTEPIKLVQDPNSRFGGILYFLPSKPRQGSPYKLELYNAVIDLNYLFAPLIKMAQEDHVHFIVRDNKSGNLMGASDPALFEKRNPLVSEKRIQTSLPLKVGALDWEFKFLAPEKPQFDLHSAFSWLILLLSLLFAAVGTLGILVITANMEELKKLIRALSHDLSNPLSVILGWSEVGERQTPKEVHPKLHSIFSKIVVAANAQKDIIEHFKMMRAIADGKNELKLSRIPLLDAIKQIEATFEQRFLEKKINFSYDASSFANLQIIAERTSLYHNVFNNLISNAIKFSLIGGAIEIKVTRDQDFILVSVCDQGIGIPKELLMNIFSTDKATSRKGTQGEEGTGFGMSVIKSYMHRYGGKIKIESRNIQEFPDDHGTCITLTFLSQDLV